MMSDIETPLPMMEVVTIPIDQVVLDPNNARKGDVSSIMDSLREFGQHRAAIVQKGTNKIIAGNHMVKAAKALGWKTIAVTYVDDDEEKAMRRALADNATGDKASWIQDILAEQLERVGAVPGIDDKMVEDILARQREKAKGKESPIYPIVPEVGEQYDYLLIAATNVTDNAWLKTRFNIPPHRSYKNQNIGRTHVISVEEFKTMLDMEDDE